MFLVGPPPDLAFSSLTIHTNYLDAAGEQFKLWLEPPTHLQPLPHMLLLLFWTVPTGPSRAYFLLMSALCSHSRPYFKTQEAVFLTLLMLPMLLSFQWLSIVAANPMGSDKMT